MAITVKHSKVSTIPDGDDSSVVRPSDWNDDHVLTGTIPVANGGTGAATLTGYVKGNGTANMTAAATIPSTDITGLGTMSTQNNNNISVTGGSISGTTVSGYIPTTEKAAALGVATLDAGGTVPLSQIPASIQGGVSYQGTWNASTNTPTLTNGVGTKGYYYVVSVAGNTNLDGITSWNVGDWAIFNGTVWQKVDNTDAVTSVNGFTGTVVLTTTNVAEGTNQYFTTARARTSVSAGTGISYDNTTGVITNASPSLGGDVVGPASATDNAIARFDTTTGKLLQNSVVTVGDTGVVTGVTELTASTKVVSPHFDAQNSAGGQLRNASGTPQLQWGGGGGNNLSVDVAININPANAQVDLSPTGTGTVRINPATASSMNNVAIGATTPLAGSFTDLSVTGTTSFDGSQGTAGQVLTSAGTGATPTWTTPTTGTVTSVTGTAPVVSSGGATPAISMAAATGSVNGYLTSTDWTTFNSKAPAVTYTTGYVPFGQGTTTLNQSANLFWDNTNTCLGIGTNNPNTYTNQRLVVFNQGIANACTAGTTTARFEVFSNGQTNNQITLGQGFGGTDNIGYLYNRANAAFVFGTNNTERMRIEAGGNIGIGYSSPRSVTNYKTLALGGTSNGGLFDMVNASGGVLATSYTDSTGTLVISADPTNAFASTSLQLQVDGTERMRIFSSGGVSIGNTTDAGANNLRVTGNATINTTASKGWIVGIRSDNAISAIYSTAVTPSSTNYALQASTTVTYVNNPVTSVLAVNDVAIASATSTGLAVTGTVRTQGYTVATLPAAGTVGRRAYVTDALAPTFLTAIVGGGAIVSPVFDNGTAWVAG
jgi:hypothetical protein